MSKRRNEADSSMARRFLRWFFYSRETGAITIAQWPNLLLWIVIAAGLLQWCWPAGNQFAAAVAVVYKAMLFVWAGDEIIRGVNPWRRYLGAAVAIYAIAAI